MSDSSGRVVARLNAEVLADCMRVVQDVIDETDPVSGCQLVNVTKSSRASLNQKGYVQIKTCTPGMPNEKVQLHQLLIWTSPPASPS
jgi:hypothetical protein